MGYRVQRIQAYNIYRWIERINKDTYITSAWNMLHSQMPYGNIGGLIGGRQHWNYTYRPVMRRIRDGKRYFSPRATKAYWRDERIYIVWLDWNINRDTIIALMSGNN